MKEEPNGFESYLCERESRLECLADEWVKLKVGSAPASAERGLEISIADSGAGFDVQEYLTRNPTGTETPLTKLHGRGIQLVRQLSEKVAYSRTGNAAEVRFRWSASTTDAAAKPAADADLPTTP